MRVFVYEFVSGGGWRSCFERPPPASLLLEGRAMANAICEDFARSGVETIEMGDNRRNLERTDLSALTKTADWTLLVAPESDRILLDRCRWVLEAGGRLLSPGPEVVGLASNKQRTAEHLQRHLIPVPPGILIEAGTSVTPAFFPAVVKRIDGCGSQGVRRIDSAEELDDVTIDKPHRLERFVPGLPASVAVLCGPEGLVPLPACEQRLSGDGRFAYQGGRTPIAPMLDERARQLALAAVGTLPDPLGYIGIDLVLGDDPQGSGDYVIEINPRLTTSYVGLRAACRNNLAEAMLAVAAGRQPSLSWHNAAVEFSCDGRVRRV